MSLERRKLLTALGTKIVLTEGPKEMTVEPTANPVITQKLNGEEMKPAPHKIQGIGAGFIPDNLDLSVVDKVEQVSNEGAIEFARRIAKEEGIWWASLVVPPPPSQSA